MREAWLLFFVDVSIVDVRALRSNDTSNKDNMVGLGYTRNDDDSVFG